MEHIKNKKLAIYPYNPDFATVLRRSDIINASNEIFAIAPAGLGVQGKDSGEIDGGSSVGINIVDDFDSCLEEVDSIIFLDYESEKNDTFYNSLYKSARRKKDIILLAKIDEKVDEEIQTISNQNSSSYLKYLPSLVVPYSKDFAGEVIPDKIQKIDVPVIMIIGLSEYTNKFDVNLMLYRELQKMEYKVSSIGSRSYCEFFGFHSFPEFMVDDKISGERKVLLFNNFLKSIESREKPDVILLTIPGGVLPVNNKITNGYGILAYEVSQAVKPDITVLCTSYEDHKADFFPRIFLMLKHRFEFEPDLVNISNIKILWGDTRFRENISYLRVSSNKVDEVVDKLKDAMEIPVFNSLNDHSPQQITNCIMNKLEDNLYVV